MLSTSTLYPGRALPLKQNVKTVEVTLATAASDKRARGKQGSNSIRPEIAAKNDVTPALVS